MFFDHVACLVSVISVESTFFLSRNVCQKLDKVETGVVKLCYQCCSKSTVSRKLCQKLPFFWW